MSGKELWEAFIMENNFVECHYETWAFGGGGKRICWLI